MDIHGLQPRSDAPCAPTTVTLRIFVLVNQDIVSNCVGCLVMVVWSSCTRRKHACTSSMLGCRSGKGYYSWPRVLTRAITLSFVWSSVSVRIIFDKPSFNIFVLDIQPLPFQKKPNYYRFMLSGFWQEKIFLSHVNQAKHNMYELPVVRGCHSGQKHVPSHVFFLCINCSPMIEYTTPWAGELGVKQLEQLKACTIGWHQPSLTAATSDFLLSWRR
jgi:hypothetical protein